MKTLQQHLRDLYVSHGISHIQEAADRIDADAERIKALEADAERYRWLRHGTTGVRDSRGRMDFELPDPHPLGNIMRGSVAQHLDAAIDAARGKT